MKSKNIIKILIPKDKKVDLVKLDTEIGKEMGWKRHKTEADKDCYSGLNFIQDNLYEDGKPHNVVEIV